MTNERTEFAYIHEGGVDILQAPEDTTPQFTLSLNPVDVAYSQWLTDAFAVSHEDGS
jgi:hypothetical protein